MHSQTRELETFDDVVAVLGGIGAVGRICEGQNSAAVCNWKRRRSRFPTKYYIVMKDELDARGASAPPRLWGFVESKRRR
jgi:hypothetical protein